MKAKPLLQLGICLLLAAWAGLLHAEPQLNGLAVSTEFGKERFIAGLYADVPTSNAEEMLATSGERRMELKVTADSLSARSINSMWVEGMAINNPASALESQAENLAKLNNLIRKRLRAGDVLSFTAVAGSGTTVTLNGIKLGTIRSDEFFPMLLRTWIGSIPLSSEFKDGLLTAGQVDGELAARYASIEPSDARIATVETWIAPEPPQVADSGITPPKPDVSITPPPPVGAAPAVEKPEVEAPKVAAVTPRPAAEEAPEPTPAQPAEPSASKPAAPKPDTAPTQVAKAPPPAPTPAAEEDDDEEAEEVMVTAESLLLRQRYISDVMRQTLQNMRYPRRALERAQEGSIRLAVTVSRTGELTDVQIVEESPHTLLNREAMASVERASPFSAVPDGIAGESFAFGIPITFRLQQ